MKKRILSILLAAMMVVSIFVMPTSVSAAEVSNNYSYKFKETDARNFVDGQVFDVAAMGEAKTAPVIDGEIDDEEYATSGFISLNSSVGGATPMPALPVSFNVKDGYLYVAFAYFKETSQKDIQFDIGVSQDERSDGAWSRKQVTWKADNTTGDHSYLFKVPGTSDWSGGDKAMDSDEFLVDYKWQDGVYEAKFDLERYYRLFGISCRGIGIYDTPCVTIAIWYNVSNTIPTGGTTVKDPSSPGQSHYAFKTTCNVNSAVTTGWLPATVIIPAESLALIRSTKGVVGELGTDWRNAVEGQFVGVDKYAAVDPLVDGVIGSSEYQVSATYNSAYSTDGKITFNYSVGENGLIYVGLQYHEAEHKGLVVHTGLVPDSGLAMKNRAGFQINTSGVLSAQSMWYLDAVSTGWCKQTFGTSSATTGKNDEQLARADVSAATSHKDGTTVYEYTLSIPMFIAGLEDHSWGADSANVLMTFAFPAGGNQVMVDGCTAELAGSLNADCGTSYSPGYFSPMFGLPEDAIERFKVSNADDLEAFGQHHLNPTKNTVTLDGVIADGEYGASYEYTNANFAKKGIVGTNYFTGDDEWFYIGAKVYDPVYKPGTTYYQYDISILSEDKVDCAESVRRLNGSIKVNADGTVALGTPGIIWRTQTCTGSGGAEEVAAKARMSEIALVDFVKGNAIYDADTKTVTYEIAIKKSAIIKTFNLDASKPLEKIGYFNYYYNSEGLAEFNYLLDTAKVYAVLQGLTRADHNGALAYGTVMPAGAIITLKDDFATKNTASVRMSTENSGLRFKTVYSDAYLAEMKAYAESKGKELEIGTLIAPYDYVLDVYSFTHSALDGKYGAGKGYVEVMATVDTPISSGAGTTTYAGSIVKIKDGNLDREFAGIGFIKIGNEYFYSDVFTVKSISNVASSAIADTASAQGNGYNYEVSAGVWSPYSEAQRSVLNTLIAK